MIHNQVPYRAFLKVGTIGLWNRYKGSLTVCLRDVPKDTPFQETEWHFLDQW
jgi:hypothetical protein